MSGWQQSPFRIPVKAGETKYFCQCGQSKNGPFCDGSHKGTGKTPLAHTFEKDDTVGICGCRKTHNSPFCDGTHTKPII